VHVSPRPLTGTAFALLVVACICTSSAAAQSVGGTVRGEVTDTQGGVLPGVTVLAKSEDDQVLGRTISDEVGQFAFDLLPAGPTKIVFELDGFETSVVRVVVQSGTSSSVVERLKLARMTEDVVVYGKLPEPPPPPLPRYEPTPPPVVAPVSQAELESVCRPAKPGATLGPFGTIRSHRYAFGRELYAKGDELVINGGTSNGLEVGRNLVVLRYFRANSKGAKLAEMGEHTAGLVQIVAATEDSATAIVVHACNELRPGDLLASFKPEFVRTAQAAGEPVYDDAARILFADAGQMLGAPRRLLVIDRGSDQGIAPGNRLTLFRRDGELGRPEVLGEAIVIVARPNSATIRVVNASDAIEFGDWAAPQDSARK